MPRLHARPFTSTFFIAKDAPMVCAAHAAARVSSQQRRVDRSAARIELRHARRSFRRTYCRGTGRLGKFCRHQAGLRTHGLRLSCRDARVVDCLGLQTHRGAPTSDQLAPWRERFSGRRQELPACVCSDSCTGVSVATCRQNLSRRLPSVDGAASSRVRTRNARCVPARPTLHSKPHSKTRSRSQLMASFSSQERAATVAKPRRSTSCCSWSPDDVGR